MRKNFSSLARPRRVGDRDLTGGGKKKSSTLQLSGREEEKWYLFFPLFYSPSFPSSKSSVRKRTRLLSSYFPFPPSFRGSALSLLSLSFQPVICVLTRHDRNETGEGEKVLLPLLFMFFLRRSSPACTSAPRSTQKEEEKETMRCNSSSTSFHFSACGMAEQRGREGKKKRSSSPSDFFVRYVR